VEPLVLPHQITKIVGLAQEASQLLLANFYIILMDVLI
jgi:hypothetical protein